MNIPDVVKKRIEKTATFAAKYGADFEKKVLSNEGKNPQFSFMLEGDPLHQYYLNLVAEYKEALPKPAQPQPQEQAQAQPTVPHTETNGTSAVTANTAAVVPPIIPSVQQAQAQQQQKQEPPPKPRELTEPEPLLYILEIPDSVSPLDYDTIRLVAQFVAKNGDFFQSELASRESKNPQFDFLKPTNHLYEWFKALVESYQQIIYPPHDIKQRLQSKHFIDKQSILERSVNRFEYDKREEMAKKKADEEADQEKQMFHSIDWGDFVVVDTIEFFEEDLEDLPQPKTHEQLLKMDHSIMINDQNQQNQEMDVEEDNDMDMDSGDMDTDMNPDMRVDSDEPKLKIVKDYTKTIRPTAEPKVLTQRCSYCQQDISVKDFTEHMKLEHKSTVKPAMLPSNQNTATLTKQTSNPNPSAPKIIWDGHTSSIPKVQAALQQELYQKQQQQQQQQQLHYQQQQQQQQQHHHHHQHYQQQPQPPPPPPYSGGQLPLPFGYPPPPPPLFMQQTPFGMAPPPLPPNMIVQQQINTETEEPSQKKIKLEPSLIGEHEFIQMNPGPFTLSVEIADGDKQGQTIQIQMKPTDTVTVLKDYIKDKISMPPNKQKLKAPGFPILKDSFTMAYYNLTNNSIVTLAQKERAGKKK
ncbi:ubiquitin domain-containing protein [Tieghemostelium lacteum]|uniref:Ubiquitin domain-containing protein n=1 Tax=Tieghemostelium lacteum TaxID=361077 RepID=A0A151ZFZ0_TIELA|nr:ubiquitin domain-containing protein [Tieghemostelium lacteum]|eukprot:KYQ92784.1 ubiquitin domain-containing protein [Tieghemostelium lacteum]